MAVDESRSLGFVVDAGNPSKLFMMDLNRLAPVASVDQKSARLGGTSYTPTMSLALDPKRQWLYASASYPATVGSLQDTSCTGVDNPFPPPKYLVVEPPYGLPVFDYQSGPDGRPAIVEKRMGPMPCTGKVQFFGLTNSYDALSDRLYMGGVPATERWRTEPSEVTPLPSLLGGTSEEDRGQALFVRQMRIEGTALVPLDAPKHYYGEGGARLVLEWEVDLRVAGCGRRNHLGRERYEGFVARLGDEVVAYCWDARPHRAVQQGQQGYLVRIPLVKDAADGVMKPATRGAPVVDPTNNQITNFVFRRVPTLPGEVTPILDQVSGRVMLVTTGATNGNAVWVFDPRAERFVGVVTGGYSDEKRGNSAVGFDSTRGRVYVLTQNGVLVAPIRVTPLPSGLIHPVLVNENRQEHFVSSSTISVAPALGRLFVAMNNGKYAVLEDHVPDPPNVDPIDPDSLTTGIEEEEGRTASSTSGQAMASGVHALTTGGLPRVVGQNDPACSFAPPNFQVKSAGQPQDPVPEWAIGPAVFGSCAAEIAATPGHREMALAAVDLEASTGSGATARAAAFTFGSNDAGDDGDIRRFSDCAAGTPDQMDRWGRQWPLPDDASINGSATEQPNRIPGLNGRDRKGDVQQYNQRRDQFWNSWADQREQGQQDYRAGCDELQDNVAAGSGQSPTGPVDLRAGTKGADGRGFPVRAAVCGDFGGQPVAETWPPQSAGMPHAGYPTSHVSCDASVPGAGGGASAGALTLPSAEDPQLTVLSVSSKVTSVRTPGGQVTVAYASASGVQVGPLSIAEIRSLAVTKAAGKKGSTDSLLVRQWCGLSLAGPESTEEQPGCVDATSAEARALLDEVSAALFQKVQLSVPEGFTQATPKGFQAVVTKSPGQRGADQTVNDDDSHTVSALQAVVYNDGPRGRSRLVVQLAGVHAESRYGIIELPNFDFGPSPEPPPADPAPIPDPEPAPPGPGGEVVPAPAVPADTFTPDSFLEEDFGAGPGEFVRFSAPPPTVRVSPPTGNPLQRVVRVPVRALSDAINLLVQNPREAALLFVMWGLLAGPVYLGLRRRAFARALVTA